MIMIIIAVLITGLAVTRPLVAAGVGTPLIIFTSLATFAGLELGIEVVWIKIASVLVKRAEEKKKEETKELIRKTFENYLERR